MLFEVEAQIEDRFPQDAGRTQHECDEQPAKAAVAIEERVNCLELDVDQTGFDEQREIRPLLVQEQLEGVHAIEDEIRRWRNEGCGPRTGAADPVLALPELAGLVVVSPSIRLKDPMNLSDEPQGGRKSPA